MKTNFFLVPFLLFFFATSVFSQQNPAVKTSDEIMLHVTLTDLRGKYVTGFDKDVFTITSDKEAMEIASFAQDEPAEVLILLDKSNSMSDYYRNAGGGKRSFVYGLILRLLQDGNAANGYGVFVFNKTQQQLLDSTTDKNAVLRAVENIDALNLDKPRALLDACFFGVEKLSQSSRKKRALVVFTRIKDVESQHTAKQLLDAAKKNNVLVYFVTVGERSSFRSSSNSPDEYRESMAAQDILHKLTSVTGGRDFYPLSAAEAGEIFQRIGTELKHQYSIGVKSNNTAGVNKWHRIKIKVTPPKSTPSFVVRSQKEFFLR